MNRLLPTPANILERGFHSLLLDICVIAAISDQKCTYEKVTKNLGRALPPLIWTKSKRTAVFFRAPFPYCNINVTVLSMVVGKSIAFADKEVSYGHNDL